MRLFTSAFVKNPITSFSHQTQQSFDEACSSSTEPRERCSKDLLILRPIQRKKTTQKAIGRATEVLGASRPGAVVLRRFGQQRDDVKFFLSDEYFIKVGLGDERAALIREASVARWAAELGISPPMLPGLDVERGVLISKFIPAEHPGLDVTRQPDFRCALLNTLRTLHTAPNPFRQTKSQKTIVLLGWQQFCAKGFTTRHDALCDLSKLKRRMDTLLPQLETSAHEYVFSHFDVIRRNLFFVDGKVLLIDWELARFAHPMRDLAKFFGYCDLRADDVHSVLCQYHLGPPTYDDSKKFAAWLQVMSIDYFAWRLLDKRTKPETIALKARHIRDVSRLLPDLVDVDWRLGAHDSAQIIRPSTPQ